MMTKTMRASNSAAAQIANHEELLTEILLKLPTKSLIKFKLVSKQWMSLISSTWFCLSHTRSLHCRGCLKPSALFLNDYPCRPSKIFLLPLDFDSRSRPPLPDFIDLGLDVLTLQSCSGLLLCATYQSTHGIGNCTYFICNPTTRKFKELSLPAPQVKDHCHKAVNLAFDPLKSPHYKIISIWLEDENTRSDLKFSIDIYSSEANTWSPSRIKFTTSNQGIDVGYGVFFKSAIHWNSIQDESLYLDLDTECVKAMPMPPIVNDDVKRKYLGECGGHLNLIVAYRYVEDLRFRVFEMADDYSNWYSKYTLNLGPEMEDPRLNSWVGPWGYEFCISRLLRCCILRSEEEEGDSMFTVFPNGKVISYNFKDRTLRRLQYPCKAVGLQRYGRFQPYQCFETLSPIQE